MRAAPLCIFVLYGLSSLVMLLLSSASSRRAKRLLIPLIVNLALSVLLTLAYWRVPELLSSVNPMGPGREELFTALVLAIIFGATIEIPGFLLNSQYDKRTVEALDALEIALLEARTNPSTGIQRLSQACSSNSALLDEAGIQSFASAASDSFKRMNNVDSSLAVALALQIQSKRDKVESRSKHPTPLLVEVLGLTCVAFILGEILAVMREAPTLR